MLPTTPLRPPVLQALLLLALPHGGQAAARRNAWAAMSAQAALTGDRRAAEQALAAADVRAYVSRTRLVQHTGT